MYDVHEKVIEPSGCHSHEGIQDHTHSSPTLGSQSQSLGSLIDISDSTLHPSTAGANQESLIEAFKRIVNSQ